MTIKQLAKAPLQGYVILSEYDPEKDSTTFPWQSEPTCDSVRIPKEYWNRNISYMFAAPVDGYSALIVEMELEDEP